MQTRRWISMFMVALVSVALLFFNVGDVMALKVGDVAPDFSIIDVSGNEVRLSDFKGKKNVVLIFYYDHT